MRRIFVLSLLLLIFITPVASAQNIVTKRIDSLLQLLQEKSKAMGSLTISSKGKIVYSKAFGFRELGNRNIPADVSTKYRIGSITKVFTAVMIYQLIEEGKLSTDTKLNKFFPQFPNSDKIAISNLLNHSSGLHNFTDDSSYGTLSLKAISETDLLKILQAPKVDFQPGAKNEYSNTNYVILGLVLQKLTGKSYQQNLTERITKKLNLINTKVGGSISSSSNEAFSYIHLKNWEASTETNMSIPGGAGSIISTPSDLVKFLHGLFTGKLLKKATVEQMKMIKNGFGSGLFQFPFYNRVAYGHTGGIDDFSSMAAFFPDDSVSVALCSNGNGGFSNNDILLGVLSIYYNKPYQLPDFSALTVPHDSLMLYTGSYSSKEIPLDIIVKVEGDKLFAQATGQSAFPLTPVQKNVFRFEQAGIEMQFNPTEGKFTLLQAGRSYLYKKDK